MEDEDDGRCESQVGFLILVTAAMTVKDACSLEGKLGQTSTPY